MALPIKKKAAAPEIDFFSPDSDIWSRGGGFELPEGDYIWTDLSVMNFDGWDGKQPPRLGVMITLVPRDNPEGKIVMASGEDHEGRIFYSFGTRAHESFAPDEYGKGIMPVPGGSGMITDKSNWMVLAKSLQDSGLPKGIASNDVSVLEGVHVHMQNVPEPEARKTFQSQTGDAAGKKEKQYTRNIAVVSEIYDDGKPWEGTGGIPEAKPAKKGLVKVPPKAAKKPEPEPELEEDTAEIDEDTQTAALGALAAVLEKAPKTGTPKAALKLNAGKAVKKDYGDDMFQAVVSMCFENDDVLEQMLDSLDFKLAGPMVKPK